MTKKVFTKKEYFNILKNLMNLKQEIIHKSVYKFKNNISVKVHNYILISGDHYIHMLIYKNNMYASFFDLPSLCKFCNGKFCEAEWMNSDYCHRDAGAAIIIIGSSDYYLHRMKYNKQDYFLLML